LKPCWQVEWVFYLRDVGAAGLLCRFLSDAAPAFHAFGCGLREMLFCSACDDGNNGSHAELCHFFDGPFHAVKFEDGHDQSYGQGAIVCDLFMESEFDSVWLDRCDDAAIDAVVGDDVGFSAGLRAKDACEMVGLRA